MILSEILALRKIVINLLYGDKAGEPLSEERMRELIEAADSERLRKATERLHAVVTARAGVLSDDEPGESVRQPPGDRAASGGMATCQAGLTPAAIAQGARELEWRRIDAEDHLRKCQIAIRETRCKESVAAGSQRVIAVT